jgi:hypothetical protein
VAAGDLGAFNHTIQSFHVSVIKRIMSSLLHNTLFGILRVEFAIVASDSTHGITQIGSAATLLWIHHVKPAADLGVRGQGLRFRV